MVKLVKPCHPNLALLFMEILRYMIRESFFLVVNSSASMWFFSSCNWKGYLGTMAWNFFIALIEVLHIISFFIKGSKSC